MSKQEKALCVAHTSHTRSKYSSIICTRAWMSSRIANSFSSDVQPTITKSEAYRRYTTLWSRYSCQGPEYPHAPTHQHMYTNNTHTHTLPEKAGPIERENVSSTIKSHSLFFRPRHRRTISLSSAVRLSSSRYSKYFASRVCPCLFAINKYFIIFGCCV